LEQLARIGRRTLGLLLFAAVALAGSVDNAAEKVLAAHRAKSGLKKLAAKTTPDPWLVADALCAGGHFAAAKEFAEAAANPKLARYFATQPAASKEARAAVASMDTALKKRAWPRAIAGASRVICSLWKVDDDATQALMTRFYKLWNPKDGSKGLPAATALRQAQAYIRKRGADSAAGQKRGVAVPKGSPKTPQGWDHPYYWAAWQLWGLPK